MLDVTGSPKPKTIANGDNPTALYFNGVVVTKSNFLVIGFNVTELVPP